MTVVGSVVAGILFAALCLVAFLRADPVRLARNLRLAAPMALLLAGACLLVAGVAALGGLAFAGGLAWAAWLRAAPRPPRKRLTSSIRTAALEMELDHRTGALEGIVLAGTFEGKVLGRLQWPQLRRLYGELASDAESRQLLEAYLDGRFPVWRKHTQPHVDGGQRIAPGAGAMTKEEAYKVLGLEAGAAPADVRKAHRRLLQRLHPEVGRASLLAVRINEAKDVLLSDHD